MLSCVKRSNPERHLCLFPLPTFAIAFCKHSPTWTCTFSSTSYITTHDTCHMRSDINESLLSFIFFIHLYFVIFHHYNLHYSPFYIKRRHKMATIQFIKIVLVSVDSIGKYGFNYDKCTWIIPIQRNRLLIFPRK